MWGKADARPSLSPRGMQLKCLAVAAAPKRVVSFCFYGREQPQLSRCSACTHGSTSPR
jgi:hypothetical protein